MKNFAFLTSRLTAMLVPLLSSVPAEATQPRTFVSGAGTDAGACTRAAPCATFDFALNVTDVGGAIICVDAVSNTGTLTIDKSVTIDCTGTFGEIRAPLGVDITGDRVTLRGLSILGDGAGGIGLAVGNNTILHIENCKISGFRGSPGIGLYLTPTAGKTNEVHVRDTVVTENGLAASGGGVVIRPLGTGSARVVLERVSVNKNTYGIFANGTLSTGVIVVQIKDSVVSGSTFNGISAYTAAGQSVASITVDRSSSLLNGADGILAQSSNAFVFLANSTVMSNVTGLHSVSGGNIYSYQNNQLTGNVTDGAPTAVLTVK